MPVHAGWDSDTVRTRHVWASFCFGPGTSLGAEELVAFCAGRLAGYKIPREIRDIDVLPRNANGKVLKTDLRLLG